MDTFKSLYNIKVRQTSFSAFNRFRLTIILVANPAVFREVRFLCKLKTNWLWPLILPILLYPYQTSCAGDIKAPSLVSWYQTIQDALVLPCVSPRDNDPHSEQ